MSAAVAEPLEVAEATALACRTSQSRNEGALRHLDNMIHVLEKADKVFRRGRIEARDATFAEGIAAVGALYGLLDLVTSPQAAAHLEAVYDGFLRALGSAYAGDLNELASATEMARAIRFALATTSTCLRAA